MEMLYALIGLMLGALIGFVYALLQQKAKMERLKKEHANETNSLKEKHLKDIESAKERSLRSSRSSLRGKAAEQMAPILDGFDYSPSDARFLGDPVDYVIFNGYSALRDDGASVDELEVVIVDIKSGKARLSKSQKAIEEAVNAGRVRFETIHIGEDQSIKKTGEQPEPKAQEVYPRDEKAWGTKEMLYLSEKYHQGVSIRSLAQTIQRHPNEIVDKLTELGVIKKAPK